MPILLSTISHSSGERLLDEVHFTYASDAADLGRLSRRTDTHHDGQAYTTTQTFDCTADPALAGALLYVRTVKTHDGLTVVTRHSRSALTGRLWRKSDVLGVTTAYAYDGLGRLVSRTLDSGGAHTNTMTFDHAITRGTQEAFQALATDSNGNKRCVGRDGAGRALYIAPNGIDDGVHDPDPALYRTSSRTYDGLGRVATSVQADWLLGASPDRCARTATFGYGSWGRCERVDYDDGTWRSRLFDPISLTLTATMGGSQGRASVSSGKVVTTYDVRGRPVKVARYAANADPATATPYSTRTMAYDGLHRLRSRTDALGNTTTYDYDDWNRVVRTTLPDASVLTRSYRPDSSGAGVVQIALANTASGLAQTCLGTRVFDGLGRVTSSSVGGRAWQYQYTLPNAGSESMDPYPTQITAPDGTIRQYTYIAALGNAIQTVQGYANAAALAAGQPSITQSFTYDATTGLMTSAVEGTSIEQYDRYGSGRLRTITLDLDGDTRTMRYGKYSLRGMVYQYTHVDGATRTTERNGNGTVSQVSDDTMKVTLGYDLAGRLVSWTASDLTGATASLTTTLTLDDYGRETNRNIAVASDNPNKPSWQIMQSWNAADQCTLRKTNRAGATYRMENYTYDNRNRLKSWNGSGAPVQDRYGNVLRTQTFTFDALNNITQLTSTFLQGSNTAAFYSSPADPCQLSSITNTHASYPSTVNLSYEAGGRLTDDGMGLQFTHYDVLGRLTGASNTLSGQQSTYAYDAHNRTYRQTVHGQSATYFYYKANQLVNLVQDGQATRLLRSPAGCAAQYSGGLVWLSGTDSCGSVLAANQGSRTESYSYSAYGEAPPQSASTVLGYTGQYRDPVVPGYQLGNGYRTYLPALMRFAQPDAPSYSPFGMGGIHSYAYCAGDPINGSDPSGHFNLFGWVHTWTTIWHDIGDALDRIDPFKIFNRQVTTPAVKWYMSQKWARYTPAYWALYGMGKGYQKLNPGEQQIFGEVGRFGEVLPFIPGAGELAEMDEIIDGLAQAGSAGFDGTASGGFDGTASGASDVVTSWGRFEGDAEPGPNFMPDSGRVFTAMKKPIPMAFRFAEEGEIVATREGPVTANAGDAVMTGTEGENWPIPRAKFEATYDFDENTGLASKKPMEVQVEEMQEPFSVKVSWSGDVLEGNAGDFKVTYGPGDYGIVARNIFFQTYDILDD
jgi:RHS repeat-associated protein